MVIATLVDSVGLCQPRLRRRLPVVFCAVFRYSASDRPAFERAYGPDGDWAAFFRGGIGYMGTELLASDDDYLLIDRWTSEAAYEAFLAEHREEYERRSAEAEGLYAREERVGAFSSFPASQSLELRVLAGRFAVCRLAPDAPVPAEFWSVTRTEDELSVICAEDAVPAGAAAEHGWRGLRVAGPLDFALTGVAAALTAPLAAAARLGACRSPPTTRTTCSCARSRSARAVAALEAAGHIVR